MDISHIFQLRSGHILLNSYLERFKRMEKASCPACGHYSKDVRHYLIKCPPYKHERWALFRHSKSRHLTLKNLLNSKDLALPLVNYIQATERFEHPERRLETEASQGLNRNMQHHHTQPHHTQGQIT